MNQNVRISLYIVIPIIFWMLSGIFVEEKGPTLVEDINAASIEIRTSIPTMFSPSIKLKATSNSERRVAVKAKTTGEVVEIGAKEGDLIKKDSLLKKINNYYKVDKVLDKYNLINTLLDLKKIFNF